MNTFDDIFAKLKDFQQNNVSWLLGLTDEAKAALLGTLFRTQDLTGCLVADDMGLGKTWQAIAIDAYRRSKHATSHAMTLVICPISVYDNWYTTFKELNPSLPVVKLDNKARASSWATFNMIAAGKGGVYIVNWEALRLMPELLEFKWLHIIADECHRMQNKKAQQTQALKKIPCIYKTALSGTPTTGYPDKFWSVLNWMYPKHWRSYWRFYKEHVAYDIVYPQGFHKITGPKDVEKLHRLISPYYRRNIKEDVLKDLPSKYYTQEWVDLSPPQAKAYKAMKKDMIAWVGEHQNEPVVAPVVLAQLMRLQCFAVAYSELIDGKVRMAEPSSKLDALMARIDDNPNVPLVVFSSFKQIINLLAKRLDKAGIKYGLITGDQNEQERSQTVRGFQEGAIQIVCGTIKAGGVGITLTRGSTVCFLDRDWSPALNKQAEDRLHRIGQENAVEVVDYMARGTVDLGRHQRLELKWTWVQQILGDI